MRKRVALKVLHAEMSNDAEVLARFEREAMAAAHIEHPNVAAATDFGRPRTARSSSCSSTSRARACATRSRRAARARARAPHRAADRARPRARARARHRASRSQARERDARPKGDDDPDFVKVLDFGIAKVRARDARDASERGASRSRASGRSSARPSTWRRSRRSARRSTPAADSTRVGVMLYEMLTGQHPFDADDRMAMLSMHIVAPVPPMHGPRAGGRRARRRSRSSRARCSRRTRSCAPPSARALIDAIDAPPHRAGSTSAASPSAVPRSPVPSHASRGARSTVVRMAANDAFAKTSLGSHLREHDDDRAAIPRRAPGSSPQTEPARRRVRSYELAARSRGACLIALAAASRSASSSSSWWSCSRSVAEDRRRRRERLRRDRERRGREGKSAPPDRVKAAVALGPEALEALAKEFPEDSRSCRSSRVAYRRRGRATEALRTVRALLAADPDGRRRRRHRPARRDHGREGHRARTTTRRSRCSRARSARAASMRSSS